jgi:hypothetical protein
MATEDEEIQVSSKKLYIIGAIVLLLVFGFFLGKVYTTWEFSQSYVFFYKDDVRDMCDQCLYTFVPEWALDNQQDWPWERGENATENETIKTKITE